ncbi:MAG: RNase P modulator RnpM, partial [Thermomicrobiales bacterium]
ASGGGRGVGNPPRKKRRGLKPRHIPQRTCIVTRQTGDKRGLIRIVRTPDGRVEVDPTGKKNGRGAYLTADRAIWERALAGNILSRALKVEINPEDVATLRAYAETLPASNEQ